jgi:hypothetical protein
MCCRQAVNAAWCAYHSYIEFIGATKRLKFESTEIKHQFTCREEVGAVAYAGLKRLVNLTDLSSCNIIFNSLIFRKNYKYLIGINKEKILIQYLDKI